MSAFTGSTNKSRTTAFPLSRMCSEFDNPSSIREDLVSPMFDMLFVCGLAPWLLGLVTFAIAFSGLAERSYFASMLAPLTVFYVAASILIGESHQFTSILRYYGPFRERTKQFIASRIPLWILYGCISFVLAMIVLSQVFRFDSSPTVFSSLFSLSIGIFVPVVLFIFESLVSLFPVFLAQHFCGQAQAIGIMYCRNRGFELTNYETKLISCTAWLLVIAGACSIAKPFFSNLPFIGPAPFNELKLPMQIASSFFVLYCALHFFRRGSSGGGWLPRQAVILWSSLSLFFLLPSEFMIYVWIFIPLLFHATQHWAVAWSTRQLEKDAQGLLRPRGRIAILDALLMMLPVQLATVMVLFWPLWFLGDQPILAETFSDSLTLGVQLSMLVFYFHYFTDRMVWRKRI